MTLVERQEPVTLTEPSMDQLRSLMDNPDAEVDTEETQVETEKTEAKQPEAGTGDVQQDTEPEAEPEVELPKGVQAKIAKEVAKQAELDRKIAEARSATKLKEHELEKLTGTGSDPAKTPKTEENAAPEFPDINTFEGTLDEFKAALAKARTAEREWLKTQTRETVQAELQRKTAEDAARARWDKAAQEHGEGFDKKMDAVVSVAPESMQIAISALDEWSKVAVHLHDNPAELKALADQFAAHPPGSPAHLKAVAQLGRLESKLATAAPAKEPARVIPPPLKKVAKAAEGESGEFDMATATMAQKRAFMKREGLL